MRVPEKVQIFICHMICAGLPTKVNKWKWNLETMNMCSICGTEPETEFHALIRCPHAVALRWAMRDVWTLPDEEQLRSGEGD